MGSKQMRERERERERERWSFNSYGVTLGVS